MGKRRNTILKTSKFTKSSIKLINFIWCHVFIARFLKSSQEEKKFRCTQNKMYKNVFAKLPGERGLVQYTIKRKSECESLQKEKRFITWQTNMHTSPWKYSRKRRGEGIEWRNSVQFLNGYHREKQRVQETMYQKKFPGRASSEYSALSL